MQETILIVYLVVAIALIGIILLQQGKGAEMGASFGAGGANTVFGAAGSGNVLTKTTTILAIVFFATALSISYINSDNTVASDSVLDESAVVEKVAPSLEAELPTGQDGLESQVAPAKDASIPKVEAALKAKADDAKKVVTEEEKASKTDDSE